VTVTLCCAPSACWPATPPHRRGHLKHRVEWSSRDSFGVIAAELNVSRPAARVGESEAGRRQMEFQLSDAVLQSIFEPIIVTDGRDNCSR